MALNAQHLLRGLFDNEKAHADRLEKLIDDDLRKTYCGGTFSKSIEDDAHDRVLNELQRRYAQAGWIMVWNRESHCNESYICIKLTPR